MKVGLKGSRDVLTLLICLGFSMMNLADYIYVATSQGMYNERGASGQVIALMSLYITLAYFGLVSAVGLIDIGVDLIIEKYILLISGILTAVVAFVVLLVRYEVGDADIRYEKLLNRYNRLTRVKSKIYRTVYTLLMIGIPIGTFISYRLCYIGWVFSEN